MIYHGQSNFQTNCLVPCILNLNHVIVLIEIVWINLNFTLRYSLLKWKVDHGVSNVAGLAKGIVQQSLFVEDFDKFSEKQAI